MTHTTESLMELRKLAGDARFADIYGSAEEYEKATIAFRTAANYDRIIELLDAITERVAERDALKDKIDSQAGSIDAVQAANVRLAAERDTLRAQLDALQSVDELPELPVIPDYDHRIKSHARSDEFINGFDAETLQAYAQSYARQAQAMARSKLLAELGMVEAVAVVDSGLIGNIGWVDGCELVDGQELYTRPLPAQDVNAELVKALDTAVRQNGHDMLMTGEEIRKCESALANAKAAQQKELK